MVKSELFRKIAEEQLGAVRSYITSLDKTIRKSVQYKIWRDTIFKRDDYTCQNCEVKGGTLRADHIKQFALILFENDVRTFEEALLCAQLWDVKNGRTLCDECHKNTSTYGQKVINLNHQPL